MQTDRDLYQPLIQQIEMPVVDQFMAYRIPQILFGQICSGQDNTGSEKPDQQRRRYQLIRIEFQRTLYLHLPFCLCQQIQKFYIGNLFPAGSDIFHETLIHCQLPDQKKRRSAQPYKPEILQDFFSESGCGAICPGIYS